jgi:dTMP kinase
MRSEFQNMFSLEGPDGSGKTTQIPLIKAELENRGFEVKVLKSPDTTPLGEFIRENVRTLEPWLRNNLFLLDINYTLKKNDTSSRAVVLLWDRYVDSFYTSNREMTLSESTELVKDLPRPVMTFLLDIDPQYIFSERQATLDHHSDPEWLQQKVMRYRELVKLESDRFLVIDARLPIEEITKLIADSIENMMNKIDEQ